MFVIATRELRSLFLSPLAWSILAVVQVILGLIFASRVALFMQPEIQSQLHNVPGAPGLTDIVVGHVYVWTGIIFLLVSPLLTMRLMSEERRQYTLPLLLSAPVSMRSIILGKYLGLMGFLLIMLTMVTLMPLSLLIGGTLDFGQFSSAILGVILLLAAFSAIGLYVSTITAQPTVAAIGTFGILLLLWIIDWASGTEQETPVFTYLSITNHYQALLRGLFNTEDVIYYILIISLFLILSIHHLDSERVQ